MRYSFSQFTFVGLISSVLALSACKQAGEPFAAGFFPKPGEVKTLSTCESFLSSLPKDYFIGTIQVPEDHSKPDGLQIRVAYYGKIVKGDTPVVFFNGGPGGSSWSSYRALSKEVRKEWSRSFVYIDQRGNGCSDPYPENGGAPTDDMIRRYQNYGSTAIVKDAEMIRKKLIGTQKWKVFGQSYGAFIAHRYMVVAPEGVVSAHAHANTLNSDAFFRMTNRMGAQGRVLGEYIKRYPEDEAAITVLSKSLTPDNCVEKSLGNLKMRACGYEFTQTFVSMLGFTNNWTTLHLWVHYLVRDGAVDKKNLEEFAISNVFSGGGGALGRDAAMTVLGYADRNVENPGFVTDYHGCKAIFDELKRRGAKDPELWPINECASTYQMGDTEENRKYRERTLRIMGLVQPDHLTIDALKNSLTANPNIPFYVYSGELDTFVPRESFAEEVTALGSLIKYHHFMGTGHEGFYMEPLVWRNLGL